MGKISIAALMTLLLFNVSAVQSAEDHGRLTTDDLLIEQAVEKAPYFKFKVDIYQRRLVADDCPAPLYREFAEQLRHFCPNIESSPSLREPAEALLLKNQAGKQSESAPFKVNNVDSACWNVAAAFSRVSSQFLFVWQDERNGAENPDIYGQYFNQSLVPIGTNFRIHNENSGAPQTTPAVAAASDGGFVVVWEDYRGGEPAIFLRSFNASRAAKAKEAKVDSMQINDQYFPAIAADNLGFFTIVWLQDDDGDFNIYSRKFNSLGQGDMDGFKVNTDYQYLQWEPAVASSTTGETLIVWEDKRNGNSDIFGQRVKADGSKQAGNFKITDASGGSTQWRPSVAAQSGQFVVCWEDYRQPPNAVYAQWLGATMLLTGANVRIDDAGSAGIKERPVVAIDKKKQSMFAWQDGRNGNWDIYAVWCTADRVPLNVFSLNAEPKSADQTRPRIALADSLPTFAWLSESANGEKQYVFAAQYYWTAVPVELAFFKATVKASDVYLEWTTLSESNNLGFEIQRKAQDEDFKKISFVSGKGTTACENSYSYEDKSLCPGAYTYRLKQIDFDGEYAYSNLIEIAVQGPSQFSLNQNYPNPFNGSTTIHYTLASPANVSLEIYSVLGAKIATLISSRLSAGEQSITWDGRDESGALVGSGVYVYKIQVEERGNFISESRKMVYVR